jgi:hypothetical protein
VILYAKHVYAKHEIEPASLGLTDAQGRHDANVITRVPQDRSVFPVPHVVTCPRRSGPVLCTLGGIGVTVLLVGLQTMAGAWHGSAFALVCRR